MSSADKRTVEERLAALEERTRPKRKSGTERFMEWAGLISLVLALAYSFPLGLWDRFIETEKKRTADEIAELRAAVDQSSAMVADAARSLAGISDPFLRDMVMRSLSTRLYILMTKHRAAFERHKEVFGGPEALVIGYNFQSTNQVAAALAFYKQAQDRAEDLTVEIEARRLRAKALFMPGGLQDRAAARQVYAEGAARLAQQRSPHALSVHMTLLAEWGYMELLDGDWECGQKQIQQARKMYTEFGTLMNDRGNFVQLVDQQTRALSPKPGQPKNGC